MDYRLLWRIGKAALNVAFHVVVLISTVRSNRPRRKWQ